MEGEKGWLLCPVCSNKTREKIREDTGGTIRLNRCSVRTASAWPLDERHTGGFQWS
jgi:hypothetical protein